MTRNKENLNRWQREYYHKKKNDDTYVFKRRESAKKYYHAHKTEIYKRARRYRLKNIEKYNEYRRKWTYETPQGIYSILNRRAKRVLISRDDFVRWWKNQKQICIYCKRNFNQCMNDPLNKTMRRLTIDRVDNNKQYEIGNLALACRRCNTVKNNYFTKDEMLKIGRIIHAKKT